MKIAPIILMAKLSTAHPSHFLFIPPNHLYHVTTNLHSIPFINLLVSLSMSIPLPTSFLNNLHTTPHANLIPILIPHLESIHSFLDFYALHKSPSVRWPYLDIPNYINLAVISNVFANRKEWNKFREQTIHGCVDDILEWKAPIAMKDILKPNYISLDGETEECPVTQLLVEGAPGIGKSTFAWEVCQKWGKNILFCEYSLVVLLKFRDKRVQEASTISDLFYHPHPQLQSEIINDIMLTRGHGLLLILEGFDEAPVSKRKMDSIFVRLFTGQELPKATVVLTTRPSASAELRKLCRDSHSRRVEVVGFGKEEIDRYIQCAILDEQSLSDFTKYLSLYPHIYALMYVPLNSAIVVEVFKSCTTSGTVFPKTRTQLYSSLIRTLLLRYLEGKQEKQENKDSYTSIHSFKDLPQSVYTQFHNICKLSYTGIMSVQTELIFQDLPSDFDPLELMQTCPELYVDSGVSFSYNFLHFTIQEYLAAYYISQWSSDEQVTFLIEHIENEKLKVVLRFLAGFSLSELGQDLWDSVRGFACEDLPFGEKSVLLQILHWIFESQTPSLVTSILGSDFVCFHPVSGQLLPFDWYVLVYCITNSTCDWKLVLNYFQLESVETFLKALKLQQDQQSKGQIQQMLSWGSNPAALHLLVSNLPKLSVLCNLTHLSFQESELTSEICNLLCECSGLLLCLSLCSNPIGRGGAVNLITSLTKFNTIKELNLSSTGIGFEDCKALRELLANSEIVVLNIGLNGLSPDSIQLIVDGFSYSTSLEILNVTNSSFSSENVLSLASVLRVNTRLKLLNIENCNIDCIYLANALEENTTTQLQTFQLSRNPIGLEGAVALARMLTTNKSLTKLTMHNCSVDSEGAVCLAVALQKNSTVKDLNLNNNPIGSKGASSFAKMLAENERLAVLNIRTCSIEGEGAVCLAEALENNSTMKDLDLSRNPIGSAGAVAFASMLGTNESIVKLYMDRCNIEGEGALAFSSMLMRNQSLKMLALVDDTIGVEGALKLVESLQQNTTLRNLMLSLSCSQPSFSTLNTAPPDRVLYW